MPPIESTNDLLQSRFRKMFIPPWQVYTHVCISGRVPVYNNLFIFFITVEIISIYDDYFVKRHSLDYFYQKITRFLLYVPARCAELYEWKITKNNSRFYLIIFEGKSKNRYYRYRMIMINLSRESFIYSRLWFIIVHMKPGSKIKFDQNFFNFGNYV